MSSPHRAPQSARPNRWSTRTLTQSWARPATDLPRDAMLSQAVPIQSYLTYAEAERAVDHLSDARFPVERVAIVGTDLRLVESVTCRLTLARAGIAGAATGVWLGLMVALFTAVFVAASFTAAILMLLWGVLLGATFGALFGVVAHAFTGGKRDFSSRSQLVAGRYDVMVDAELAEQARPLLAFPGGSTGAPAAQPDQRMPDNQQRYPQQPANEEDARRRADAARRAAVEERSERP